MKILTLEQLKPLIQQYKQQNKKIVWTNGCFDLFHPGHLYSLKKAKQKGDILIVGLDSDESTKKLKGPHRPIISETHRAEILSSLDFIDHIIIFNFGQVKNIIQEIKPHVYVKSGNYTLDTIDQEERKILESYQAEIYLPSGLEGFSTTEIIKKIKKQDKINQHNLFNRANLKILPLSQRQSKSNIQSIMINPDYPNFSINPHPKIEKISKEIIKARKNNKPVILTFGAHLIKNGLSLILKKLIENNYITHLATNGAASIHDWELAFHGKTEEDVRKYIQQGQFGIWQETGKYINLAIILGALKNKGYGESISEIIYKEKLEIPEQLSNEIKQKLEQNNIQLNQTITINHPYKNYSIQTQAYENNIPFTIHPGFGYDIIYSHPLSNGASIGKASEIDFLKFVNSISDLEGGVYLSIGSAIMSPMIFEKSLSMARNLAHQQNKEITDFIIVVNDIQKSDWDWNSEQEPGKSDPAYYLRFCKTFHRMNAREMHYIQQDNREFLVSLYQALKKLELTD